MPPHPCLYINNAPVWLGRVTEYHILKKEGKKDTMNYKHFREVIPSLDLEESRWYGTIYRMSLARSVRSVGRGVPDFLVVPHPKGLTWECVAAPVKVSYPGWIWKILVLHETLTRALNRIGQWRKNLGQLLCPAPTSTSLPVPYCRPFTLGSRDLSSKVANFFCLPHNHTLSRGFKPQR